MSPSRPRISLVMPAYNEEDNLPLAVELAQPPLAAISPDWEIVLVNDGSADHTAEIADALATEEPRVRVVHHAQNKGLGGALTSGFGAARGEVLAYCDADLPFDLWDLKAAYDSMMAQDADVVAGFRLRRDEGVRRRVYTAAYNGLIRALFGLDVRDVNCPLKLFRREVFEAEGLHSTGSFIDAELLVRALRNGFRIVEFGASYTPRTLGISTLSRPSVIVGILKELVQYRRGRLGPTHPRPAPTVAEPIESDPTS